MFTCLVNFLGFDVLSPYFVKGIGAPSDTVTRKEVLSNTNNNLKVLFSKNYEFQA